MKKVSKTTRFWAKVDKGGACWVWLGATNKKGYGRFENEAVHRFAYEQLVRPIPKGLVLDHLCRVRACVNPKHLEPVTNKENILRGVGWGGVEIQD